jgi:O-acetyl-ADP-ribose deacetylase (regulator of RNase III)
MIPNIIVFDINHDFVQEAQRLKKYGINVIHSNVKKLVKDYSISALVSPANSLGFMNGGIDNHYMDMFPGIQTTVQSKIQDTGLKDISGRSCLPVGSSITVKTNNSKTPYLIVSPTMRMPGRIDNTNNVFYSFLSILYIAKNNSHITIACPGLGTGIGMVTPTNAINQMIYAIRYYSYVSDIAYQMNIKYRDSANIVLYSTPVI